MKKVIISLLFLFALKGVAQENKNRAFTLQEAINHAIANNYNAINASKSIESAKQKKWETTAMGLPQISGNILYLKNLDFTEQGVSGNAFNPAGDPNAISTIAFGTKNSMDAKATLSQLIFDGSYIVALQSAKVYLQISENAKIKTDNEIKEVVTNAYGNVLLARESVAILQKNKESLSKTLFETNEIFKNGLIEEENVEQLQITLTQVNSSLSNATKMSEIALNLFKITLGIDIEENVALTDKLEDLAVKNLVALDKYNNYEINKNIDYLIGQNNIESKRLLLKLEKFRALPTIGAQLNYGYNSFANNFTFTNNYQKWHSYSNIGVSLSLPIFSSFRDKARTQQAKIAYEQAQIDLKNTEQKLKLQYQQAKNDLEFSIEQYSASRSNLELSERIEKKQQIKFKEGLSSSFDFNEAQRQLYASQQNYLQSLVNIVSKKAALEKITSQNN